jgi:peptide maturation system protein (TIGR04066 family)
MRKQLLVYPYDINFTPVLRYSGIIGQYGKIHLVAPNGWGFNGKNAGALDGGIPTDMLISSNFELSLIESDTVLFTQPETAIDFKKLLLPKINMAIEGNKNVICTLNLETDTYKAFEVFAKDKGVNFQYFGSAMQPVTYPVIEKENEYLFELSTPVVFVIGLAERTAKFGIQLSLREQFLKMGYRISQVGSRSGCGLFGFHSFPEFMYSTSINESNKVVLFNHYIKDIEEKEQPDLILIGIPGGVMPFDNKFTNRFGILAYQVCQAIEPDAVVLSVLFDYYYPEFFENMSKSIRYKLGFDVDAYYLTNVIFDYSSSEQNNTMSYLTAEMDMVEKKKKELAGLKIPVFNILSNDDALNMSNLLVNKLAEFGNVNSVKGRITYA